MSAFSRLPASWGEKMTAKTQQLLMNDEQPYTQGHVLLTGFSLPAPEVSEQEITVVNSYHNEGGRNFEIEEPIEGGYIKGLTFEIGTEPGADWTPVDKIFESGSLQCRRDFYAARNCASASEYAWFEAYEDAMFAPRRYTSDEVGIEENAPVTSTFTIKVAGDKKKYRALRMLEIYVSAGKSFYNSDFLYDECINCSLNYDDVIFSGSNGTDAPPVYLTEDRFATAPTALTHTIAAGRIVTGQEQNNGNVMWVNADNWTPGTATTGGIHYSRNRATVTAVSGITAPLYDVAYGNGMWVVVGKNGYIAYSVDMVNFTVLTTSAATTGDHIMSITYDPKFRYFYLAGFNGSNGKAWRLQGLVLSDISSEMTLTNKKLYAVKCLHKNHIAFGGESGLLYESINASTSGTFKIRDVAGTTSTIYAIGGDKHRTLVAAGTVIYSRSIIENLAGNVFEALTPAGGTASGNFRSIASGKNRTGLNYWVATTDAGEVFMATPFTPDA